MRLDIDAKARLTAKVKEHGNQRAAARELRISQQYLNDLLHGRRPFSEAVLNRLGLRRSIVEAGA